MLFHRRSSRTGIIVRITLILSLGFAGMIIALKTPFWLVSIWLGLLVVALLIELIRYLERFKKVLREFLLSIKQDEFSTLSFLEEGDTEIKEAYKIILDKFMRLRIEKEASHHYMQQVIEQVDTALICLESDLKIELINRAAMELLQVPEIKDLRAIEKIDHDLFALIGEIQPGRKEMIRFIRHGRMMKLSLRATAFVLENQTFKIVSLHDIKTELEEQELDSWQKLVRVLTHEIMNSTIPITNMITVARGILVNDFGELREIPGLGKEEAYDLMESLSTAESRSQGLVNFVLTTKSLSRIPEPSFSVIKVSDLIKRIKVIFKSDLESSSITFKVDQKSMDLLLKADSDLIEQVIINLIRNAIEALATTQDPKIDLIAQRSTDGGITLSVCDNGQGISHENLDQIFVPFYSTKSDGSGIGLSLSRQIMKLHKGRIDVQSEEGKGTCVTLEF